MVELLARDSEGTRKALAEFEARRRRAEQSVATTQAEFDQNSTFKVDVISHGPSSQTEESALRIVDALSKLGFKASSGRWAEGTPIAENIRIAYRDRAAKQSDVVRMLVATVVGDGPYRGKPIKMEPKPTPVRNSDADIVIFF
jgi:hypothetical protein